MFESRPSYASWGATAHSLRLFLESFIFNQTINSLKKLAVPAEALAKAGSSKGNRTPISALRGQCPDR